jgi:hypothetical protein
MSFHSIVLALALLGQPMPNTEADFKEVLFPYYTARAADYKFHFDLAGEDPLTLHPQPVLTWTNAENFMGAVYVWTHAGRPEVIGCIGSRQAAEGQCFVFNELHSLGTSPLPAATFGDGKRRWQPSTAGLAFAVLDDVPTPAAGAQKRLVQMRNIAREFTAAMKQDEDVTQLRLLPQPIFRYTSAQNSIVDGAIFAFVWKGTDPDLLLVLENRTSDGTEVWQYAFARFNWRSMWAKRKGEETWRVEQSGMGETSAYISGRVAVTTIDQIRSAESK